MSRRHRLLPSFWLGFLALPLVSTWGRSSSSSAHDVIVTVVVVAFAALYAYVTSRPGDGEGWSRGGRTAVVSIFVAVPFSLCFYDNAAWAYVFVYALVLTMRLSSRAVRYRAVIAMAALTGAAAVAAGASSSDVIAPVCVVLGSGASCLGFFWLLEANASLEQAQEDKAKAAVAEERLRFARDLHDLLGHSLSVIALKSEVAGRLLAIDGERAAAEVAEIEQVARQALREVREAAGGYRQTTLAVELAGARTALTAGQITWTEEVDAALDLPEAVEAALAWTIREGVTNVLRHSHAATCALHVEAVASRATVTVTDDGIGGNGNGVCGNGIRGLRERVLALGGSLESGREPEGVGYRLAASVPIGRAEAEASEDAGPEALGVEAPAISATAAR